MRTREGVERDVFPTTNYIVAQDRSAQDTDCDSEEKRCAFARGRLRVKKTRVKRMQQCEIRRKISSSK